MRTWAGKLFASTLVVYSFWHLEQDLVLLSCFSLIRHAVWVSHVVWVEPRVMQLVSSIWGIYPWQCSWVVASACELWCCVEALGYESLSVIRPAVKAVPVWAHRCGIPPHATSGITCRVCTQMQMGESVVVHIVHNWQYLCIVNVHLCYDTDTFLAMAGRKTWKQILWTFTQLYACEHLCIVICMCMHLHQGTCGW